MMVYWRFKHQAPGSWHAGYLTPLSGGLIRMGNWNGDTMHGLILDPSEIETREYR